jgi:hypothetical protein
MFQILRELKRLLPPFTATFSVIVQPGNPLISGHDANRFRQARHTVVNLRSAASDKPYTVRGQKYAYISTKLNFSAPSTLIIHLQFARSISFRLILRWNQIPRSGSPCVGQE